MGTKRQFAQMIPGASLGAGVDKQGWEVADPFDGTGHCYFYQTKLDLRGLLAGSEEGLVLDAISLQESGPFTAPDLTESWFWTCDLLTTVKPRESVIANLYIRPDLSTNEMIGFLKPVDVLSTLVSPDEQTFNPSQVTWGLWRLWGPSINFRTGTTEWQVIQSGYMGQGDMAVSPSLWWTRVLVSGAEADVVINPSANLLSYGEGVNITAPQEMTAMMRGSQR
jgi:hypothetical protein